MIKRVSNFKNVVITFSAEHFKPSKHKAAVGNGRVSRWIIYINLDILLLRYPYSNEF